MFCCVDLSSRRWLQLIQLRTNVEIPDNDELNWPLDVEDEFEVFDARLTLTGLYHPYPDDLVYVPVGAAGALAAKSRPCALRAASSSATKTASWTSHGLAWATSTWASRIRSRTRTLRDRSFRLPPAPASSMSFKTVRCAPGRARMWLRMCAWV